MPKLRSIIDEPEHTRELTILRERGGRVVLNAERGSNAERFLYSFRATWARLPMYARRVILNHWRMFDVGRRPDGGRNSGKLPVGGLYLHHGVHRQQVAAVVWQGLSMHFWEGSLLRMPDEDEAGVIAHELAHVFWVAAEGLVIGGYASGDWMPTKNPPNRPDEVCPCEKFANLLAHSWGFECGDFLPSMIEKCKKIDKTIWDSQGMQQLVEDLAFELS